MISDEEYEQVSGRVRRSKSLVQFFRDSPLVGVELDLERAQDTGREIEAINGAGAKCPQVDGGN
jgi:hypothetical protein